MGAAGGKHLHVEGDLPPLSLLQVRPKGAALRVQRTGNVYKEEPEMCADLGISSLRVGGLWGSVGGGEPGEMENGLL